MNLKIIFTTSSPNR